MPRAPFCIPGPSGACVTALVDLVAHRLNTRLESANIPTMKNLATDLSDGVRLCQLMVRWRCLVLPNVSKSDVSCSARSQEIMSQTSLGRYNQAPRMRVQKAENVNKALQFIKGSGVVLTNIGPEGEPYKRIVVERLPGLSCIGTQTSSTEISSLYSE